MTNIYATCGGVKNGQLCCAIHMQNMSEFFQLSALRLNPKGSPFCKYDTSKQIYQGQLWAYKTSSFTYTADWYRDLPLLNEFTDNIEAFKTQLISITDSINKENRNFNWKLAAISTSRAGERWKIDLLRWIPNCKLSTTNLILILTSACPFCICLDRNMGRQFNQGYPTLFSLLLN